MQSLPQALPQFSHIMRYWDASRNVHVAQVLPGEVYVTNSHELVTTLLGSCISVCMRDKINRVGGINHFKLPKPLTGGFDDENTNYGIYAMELLINEILKNGGNKNFLECTVFGGGNVSKALKADVGGKNIEFVLSFLKQESIPIVNQDIGHDSAQKIYYHPVSGNTFSVVVKGSSLGKVNNAETEYLQRINNDVNSQKIEFF